MEEKITYTGVTFSTNLLSFLHETLLSSYLHKENKNYIKETKNLSYKLQNSLTSTLYLVLPFAFEIASIYRRNAKVRVAWRSGKLDNSEFGSSPYLQTWFDVDI